MEEKYENRIKELLTDVDKEFLGLNHFQRAKFALAQISSWQQKFNEAKYKIPREKNIDATSRSKKIDLIPEIDVA